MRTFELIVAVIIGLVVLVVLQVLGVILKFALAAAFAGFPAGLSIARLLRRTP